MNALKSVPAVLAFAALHFIASFIISFAGGVTGGIGGRMLRGIANVLLFPLSLLDGGPDSLFWVLWGLLSFVWGVVLVFLLRRTTKSEIDAPNR